MTAAEKREAVRLVEDSDLSVRRTPREIQIPRASFYRWYRRYQHAGIDGLQPRPLAARRYWDRIPPPIRQRVVNLALGAPELTPRELAWQFTDRERHFLSESSVYRILKAYDLNTSPALVVRCAGKTQLVCEIVPVPSMYAFVALSCIRTALTPTLTFSSVALPKGPPDGGRASSVACTAPVRITRPRTVHMLTALPVTEENSNLMFNSLV